MGKVHPSNNGCRRHDVVRSVDELLLLGLWLASGLSLAFLVQVKLEEERKEDAISKPHPTNGPSTVALFDPNSLKCEQNKSNNKLNPLDRRNQHATVSTKFQKYGEVEQIGRANVCNQVTNEQIVSR